MKLLKPTDKTVTLSNGIVKHYGMFLCTACGAIKEKRRDLGNTQKYCSVQCASKHRPAVRPGLGRIGPKSFAWKGGRTGRLAGRGVQGVCSGADSKAGTGRADMNAVVIMLLVLVMLQIAIMCAIVDVADVLKDVLAELRKLRSGRK